MRARARAPAGTVACVVRSPEPTSSARARRTSGSSSVNSIPISGMVGACERTVGGTRRRRDPSCGVAGRTSSPHMTRPRRARHAFSEHDLAVANTVAAVLLDAVAAGTAVDDVGAAADLVRAVAADDRVVAAPALELVAAEPAVEAVVAGAPEERVAPAAADEVVVAAGALEEVVAALA